jgi:hypothetical protein
MEVILEEFKLLCAIQISPNIFVLIIKLGLEGSILSIFCGIGIDCCTFCGFNSRSYICFFASYWA